MQKLGICGRQGRCGRQCCFGNIRCIPAASMGTWQRMTSVLGNACMTIVGNNQSSQAFIGYEVVQRFTN
jgi:hypothetical protein